jgi:cobalt-zinc-cadmium efflux system outer membrane protein
MKRLVSLLLLIGAGCQTAPKDSGFGDVQRTVSDRSGFVVQWNRDSSDDRAVDTTIEKMLTHELGVDETVQIALLNNRHLQVTFEDLGIAQADLVQAGLLKNPVFDLGVRFPDSAPSGTYLDIAAAGDFLDIALLPARKKLAAAQFEQAKAKVSNEVLSLAAETSADFYAYQAAEETADLRRSEADAASAALEATKKLHEAGNLNDLNFADQRAQEVRARIDLSIAEAQATEAREKLAQRMGLDSTQTQWKVADHLADLPANEIQMQGLESLAVQQRLDLLAARQEVLAQAQTLGLTTRYRFFQDVNVGPEFEHETDGQWRIGPSVSMPIPIFDNGQAKISRAQAILRQNERRYQAMEIDVRAEVRIARAKLISARAKALLYRDEVLPAERDVLHQTQLQYNGMYVGVFQLLDAKREQTDAAREYIEALRDYWSAKSELARAIGGKFPAATTQPSAKK